MALSESFFQALVAGDQKAFWPVFLHSSARSWTNRAPLLGGLLCNLAHQSLKRTPWVGSYSAVQCGRHLMGQPLYHSAADAGVWAERGHGDVSTHYAWLSSITLLPCLHNFPPKACLTTISSLTSPQSISLQSTAALTLECLHNP